MSNDEEEEEELFFTGPKDYDEQTDSFRMDLENLIYRYIDEYDINTITIIGALQEQIEELCRYGDVEFESEIDLDEDLDEDE